MEYIGNKGIVSILKENTSLDYLAFVITPWHAHSLEAAIMQIESQNNTRLKGIIIVKDHVISSKLIDQHRFEKLDAIIYNYKNDENLIDGIKNELNGAEFYFRLREVNKKPFYVFKPNGFRYPILSIINKACNKNRKLVAVSIDEGLGIYLLTEKEWFNVCLNEQKNLRGKIIAWIKHYEISILNEKKLMKYNQYIDNNLLVKDENGVCHPNGNMPYFFRTSIEMYANNLALDICKFPKKYILVNTQPFDDYTDSDIDIKLEVLKRCINIMNEKGYKVIIKPHPREDNLECYNNIGAEVMGYSKLSQESLLAMSDNKPSYILSYCSTTLVSAKLLFNIPTISISQLLLNTSLINEKYTELLTNFHNTFSSMITFVNDYNELSLLLK